MSEMSQMEVVQTVPIAVAIESAKKQLRQLFASKKEVVLRLGHSLENKEEDTRSICIRIKHFLKEEIADGVISARQIEICCLDEWKRQTRPKTHKNEQNSFRNILLVSAEGLRKPVSSVIFKVRKSKFQELMTAIRRCNNECYLRFDQELELAIIQTDGGTGKRQLEESK